MRNRVTAAMLDDQEILRLWGRLGDATQTDWNRATALTCAAAVPVVWRGSGRRGFDCQPMCWSLRPTDVAPDVVPLVHDATDYGIGLDGCGHWILRAKLERLTELPSLRAAAPRNIPAGFVARYGEEFLSVALEQVSGSCIVLHRQTFLMAFEAAGFAGEVGSENLGP